MADEPEPVPAWLRKKCHAYKGDKRAPLRELQPLGTWRPCREFLEGGKVVIRDGPRDEMRIIPTKRPHQHRCAQHFVVGQHVSKGGIAGQARIPDASAGIMPKIPQIPFFCCDAN